MGLEERVAQLHDIPLLARCDEDELAEIASVAEERHAERGTVLCEQGAPGDACYLVLEGTVVVRVDGEARGTAGTGDVLGELALIESQPRMATCVAADDVTYLSIDVEAFSTLLDRLPNLCRGLLVTLSRRVREVQQPVSPWG